MKHFLNDRREKWKLRLADKTKEEENKKANRVGKFSVDADRMGDPEEASEGHKKRNPETGPKSPLDRNRLNSKRPEKREKGNPSQKR